MPAHHIQPTEPYEIIWKAFRRSLKKKAFDYDTIKISNLLRLLEDIEFIRRNGGVYWPRIFLTKNQFHSLMNIKQFILDTITENPCCPDCESKLDEIARFYYYLCAKTLFNKKTNNPVWCPPVLQVEREFPIGDLFYLIEENYLLNFGTLPNSLFWEEQEKLKKCHIKRFTKYKGSIL